MIPSVSSVYTKIRFGAKFQKEDIEYTVLANPLCLGKLFRCGFRVAESDLDARFPWKMQCVFLLLEE